MVIGKVKDILFKSQYAEIKNPAIIVVGEVVKFHPSQIKDIVKSNSHISFLNIKQ
jgi:uroporphyrin-III C-methyltransferase